MMEMNRTNLQMNDSVTTQPFYTAPRNSVSRMLPYGGQNSGPREDPQNTESIKEMEAEVALLIVRAISYFLLALLFYINFKYPIPIEGFALILIALDVFFIVYHWREYFHIDSEQERKRYYNLMEAIHSCIIAAFKFMIYLRLRFGNWYHSWACMLLLTALVVRIILINSFSDEFNSASTFLKTFFRIVGFALCSSVLFKIDGLSDMAWTSVFWPYWVCFAILILLSLSVILMSCGSGCSLLSGVISINEFIVSLWLFFAVVGFTFVSE